METLFPLLALCKENPSFTGSSPNKGQAVRSFDVFFGIRLNSGVVDNLGRNNDHVTSM